MTNTQKKHILISRVDAIGDVVLTLPLCGYLKKAYPLCTVSFLGRTYTGNIILACKAIDHFINIDELNQLPASQQAGYIKALNFDVVIHVFPRKHLSILMKKAGIPIRIGTTNRWYHWFTCNKLVRLSRKKSLKHEAMLNLTLLKPLGLVNIPNLSELSNYYEFVPPTALPASISGLISTQAFNLIIHPKSSGSAREWPLDSYQQLIKLLGPNEFKIFITGSEKEKVLLKEWIAGLPPHIVDLTGCLNLQQLITFIAKADGLIAASTGPLHIAAAAGVHTMGLYPSTRGINATRWGPIGKKAEYIESGNDQLINISANNVYSHIKKWIAKKPESNT